MNTWCIRMSEAAQSPCPSLLMITSIVFEESLARDSHTDIYTDTASSVLSLNYDFENKPSRKHFPTVATNFKVACRPVALFLSTLFVCSEQNIW